MEDLKNRLSQVPIASLNRDEERQIQHLEHKFGDKYYLIAFEKVG